eukprot:SAG31_NODE_44165_length_264_cov_0.618182_1_plen_62_part_10
MPEETKQIPAMVHQNDEATASKKAKKTKGSGGFESMGLSPPIYKAIIRKGYRMPTPIQRKVI